MLRVSPTDLCALQYANRVSDARAVFETTVGRLTANPTTISKARPIFSYLHEYESHFGELSQVARLEQRMRDLYPEDHGLKQFSQRFVSSNFDPTSIRPIVSPQQIRPKGYIQPSIEAPEPHPNSPPSKLLDAAISNSPKRPFPGDDFEDQSPRKLARGESPLKGAAGRRMDQQKRQNVNGYPPSSLSQAHVPPPSPLPGQINFLLSIIPKASTYVDARFDPVKMVELMRDVRLPPPGSLRQPEHQPSSSWPPPPQFQQQQPPVMHSAFPPPGQGMGQPQYPSKCSIY
jgi:cleavage stimulation factor subunit 3